MFVQVIQGPVAAAQQVRAAIDRWLAEAAPGAIGWLGTTAGVTDDGTFIALARFESADAARRNSERAEQDQWWQEFSKLFTGEVTFHDCTDVAEMGSGGSDDAGFVQVIQGRLKDPARMREMAEQMTATPADYRPDVIGGFIAFHGDGGYTTAVDFTSEAEAREGESKERPAEIQEQWDQQMAMHESGPTYLDLHEAWLLSPT